LSSVPPETDYAFQIARLITQSEFDLDALRNSLLGQRPMFFARLLDGRREWGVEEMTLIGDVVHGEEVPSELKQKIWSSLEALVRDPGSSRAYHLADAMQNSDEWQRAIPLWRDYIKHASPTSWEGYKSNAITNLFRAYCRTKQWQAAEKILLDQQDEFWRVLPNALAEVAVVAAQQNAIDDAMRLWRKSTNLDRRNLEILAQLRLLQPSN
jgi:tetratricopeptide (TPR) repeat protein